MRISKPVTVGAMAAAVALSVLAGPAAQAAPAPNGYLDSLTMAGSDTIQDVDTALAARFNLEASDGDRVTNVPAQFSGTVTASGDRFCAPITYTASSTPATGQTTAPNGSGAGKTALNGSAAAGNGCVDIARSSSGRGSSDPTGNQFQYFAFAKDAVGYATYGLTLNGSAGTGGLTTADLRGIYNCTYTNFSQVGGPNQPIQRYLPQAGSGTRNFFVNTVLGGADPTTVSTASCPAVKISQENDGTVASGSKPGVDQADITAKSAILPFSAAQLVAQANQTRKPDGTAVADLRNGLVIGSLDGQNPVSTSSTGVVSPNTTVYNSSYIGARNVYHVLDTRSPSYSEALRYVGFDADPTTPLSQLCSGSYAAVLQAFGFAPLPAGRTGNSCTQS
jgi:phosphate transport system substrate-binding protein